MKITVMSKLQAIEHSIKSDIEKCIVISINSLDSDGTYFYDNDKIKGIFFLYFNDIERDYEEAIAPRQKNFNGLKNFIDKYKDDNEIKEIIVHCAAGISRSSAVAAAICQYLNIDEYKTIWSKPCYIPNTLVYRLAINELELKMCEAQFAFYLATNKNEREKQELPIDVLNIFN